MNIPEPTWKAGPDSRARCQRCDSQKWDSAGDCLVCESPCCDQCGELGDTALVCHRCLDVIASEVVDDLAAVLCDPETAAAWRLLAESGCTLDEARAYMSVNESKGLVN